MPRRSNYDGGSSLYQCWHSCSEKSLGSYIKLFGNQVYKLCENFLLNCFKGQLVFKLTFVILTLDVPGYLQCNKGHWHTNLMANWVSKILAQLYICMNYNCFLPSQIFVN